MTPTRQSRGIAPAGAVVSVESTFLHGPSDRGVERPFRVGGHRDRELDRVEEQGTDAHRPAHRGTEPTQLARPVEAGAVVLDAPEPAQDPLHGVVEILLRPARLSGGDDLRCEHRAHHARLVHPHHGHFAFDRASTTA
jgi:hypothetical protein